MARSSLGLTAYRALTRHSTMLPKDTPLRARPKGELVWIHAGEPGNLLAVQDFAMRLISSREGLHVLITLPEQAGAQRPLPARADTSLIQMNVPGEHPEVVSAFLDHWQPDSCIWIWGNLRPNLVLEAADRGCPMFLIDADARGFDGRRDRWLPALARRLLSKFDAVFARSANDYKRLSRLDLPSSPLNQTGPLLAGGQVLPCVDSDLNDLSAAVGGRPTWFAAGVTEREIGMVLGAHKQALRLSHRLLLILQPDVPEKVNEVLSQAASRNITTAQWDDGQFPDDTTQLLISSDAAERGLFFRLASVSFLGGTLIQGRSGGCDPLEAAALGSAILYGPRLRQFMPSYSRLAAAGAARIVNDVDALGTAVSRLIAPDQAATMAHAGWDVISQGAELTDRIIDLIQDALDRELSRT
ncbi:3-deoxy-D-manno-octulosonic acid transferase [Sulfitobacter pacificus]|uniref:3-deoxy-D-manno-octulosonic acid transferase n=2 Tax=Sulfitobacter pacificus TaxID=1499314 RepID=A0ABQ5VN56_9RHOB|nr:glycosyltransferase N-terminal domain-containing protein [Sulfitobacter pacificus]GLQ28611.1 3-deoxy-D-manno-octulosonic acid transferase [Sulfitobacter pacificus]